MNDIAKKATADRFLSALKKEGLTKKEAGDIIGIYPPDVTKLLNEKYWPALSSTIWDKVLAWANSGYSLREYPRHKRETSQVIQSSDEVATEIKKDPDTEQQSKKAELPGHSDTAISMAELSEIRFIALLIQEKALLREKMDAINNLLELYNNK